MFAMMLGATLIAASPAAADTDLSAIEARAVAAVDAAYDSSRGGWVDKQGVPSEAAIELGLWRGREGDAVAMARALETLAFVHTLRDTVGGGYVRSARDLGVLRATLDKSSVPQVRRLEVALAALEVTGDPKWRAEAAFTADFMDRVLLDGRGGFHADQLASASLVPSVNALAIAAWFRWAAATGDPRPRDFATRSLADVTGERLDPRIGVLQWSTFGEVESVPRLADQIETARALLVAWRVTGRARDLEMARMLADSVVARYEEPGKGLRAAWSPTGKGARRPGIRADENARAARLFAELSVVAPSPALAEASERIVRAFAKDIGKDGLDDAHWALAMRSLREPWLPEAPKAWGVGGAVPVRRPATRR